LGLQTDVDYRITPTLRIAGAYIYDVAKVRENAANPALVGLQLAQVPAHRGAFQVQYSEPRLVTVVLDVQASGAQFDDDLNTPSRVLPKYAVANVSVSRRVAPLVEAFAAVQNLFDEEYVVGSLPTLIGPPRMVSAGVRIGFQGRP
jgi:iron complex outermembrane receptor protein